MRKVAVFWVDGRYDRYDDYEKVITSITAWEKISDEDFAILQRASYKKGFSIVEQPVAPKEFIATTIRNFLADEHAAMIKEAAASKKRAEAALKNKESKRELFEKLKKELEQE